VLDENLLYQDLILRQPNEFGQMVNMVVKVPETWIDLDELPVFYPHPTYNIGGLYPDEWSEPLFNRRRFPNPTFVEHVIHDFLFASGGKLLFPFLSYCSSIPSIFLVSFNEATEAYNSYGNEFPSQPVLPSQDDSAKTSHATSVNSSAKRQREFTPRPRKFSLLF